MSPRNVQIKQHNREDLLLIMLRKIYCCEGQAYKMLKGVLKKATKEDLKVMIENYIIQGGVQAKRLSGILKELGSIGKMNCSFLDGILQEGKELIGTFPAGSQNRDIAIITLIQQVAYQKISIYSIIATLCRMRNRIDLAEIIEHNVIEEKERQAELTVMIVMKYER